MKSKKWRMNKKEWEAVGKNALIFLAPVLTVEVELISKGASVNEMMIAFKVWAMGVALDFLRKLKQGE